MSDLPNKEVCVAMSWSGDYAAAANRALEAGIDIDLRYTAPKEGSGLEPAMRQTLGVCTLAFFLLLGLLLMLRYRQAAIEDRAETVTEQLGAS